MNLLLLFLVNIAFCYDYSQFVVDYNRKPINDEEYWFRKKIFDANYSKIIEVNSQDLPYKLAVNNWTDWTYEELRRKGLVKRRNKTRGNV